jgi:hypothetical protein
MDREYGFYIMRPFFFRSRMPMRRVMELVPWYARLRKYYTGRRKQQTWRFDRVKKVISNMNWTNYCLSI